jgi:mRNA interferase MazF
MSLKRDNVILVDFPYPSGTASKVRPALVIQNDKDNSRLQNTVVVQITSATHRSGVSTQVLLEVATADGKLSGLVFDSAVNCVNIATLDQSRVRRRLGNLSFEMMRQVDEALKAALGMR